MPTIISSAETAIRLGISLRTLARLKRAGILPYVVLSKRHHAFREEDVISFINSRTTQR